MMVGGALGAVSPHDPKPPADNNTEMMNPMIGGQAMMPERDTMTNMAGSPMHTRLVAALNESGVAAALKQNGQFTLFAPTDAAFAPGAKASLAMRKQRAVDRARDLGSVVEELRIDGRTSLRQIAAGLNNKNVREYAKAFAKRVAPADTTPFDEAVKRAYALALGRAPDETELRESVAFLEEMSKQANRAQALADFCQAVMGLNEFVYVE